MADAKKQKGKDKTPVAAEQLTSEQQNASDALPLKRGRGRPKGTGGYKRPDRTAQLEPGDNTKYLNHALAMLVWKQPDMTSVEAVEQRVCDYFQLCADNDMKPTFAGMALAFGVDRRTMWKWCNNAPDGRHLSDSVRDSLKKGYQILNAQMEDYMSNGKVNPVSGIFLMKNNMGYRDEQEVVLRPDSQLGEQASPDELQKKYIEDTFGGATIEGEIVDSTE